MCASTAHAYGLAPELLVSKLKAALADGWSVESRNATTLSLEKLSGVPTESSTAQPITMIVLTTPLCEEQLACEEAVAWISHLHAQATQQIGDGGPGAQPALVEVQRALEDLRTAVSESWASWCSPVSPACSASASAPTLARRKSRKAAALKQYRQGIENHMAVLRKYGIFVEWKPSEVL